LLRPLITFLDLPESQYPQQNPQNPSLLKDYVGIMLSNWSDRIKQIQRSAIVRDSQSLYSHILRLQTGLVAISNELDFVSTF